MTLWLHEIQKNLFLKEQTIQWMDIMSIRFIDSQMIYSLYTLQLCMLLVCTIIVGVAVLASVQYNTNSVY